MTQEFIEQIYGGEKTAEATKILKYIYAGAQPIEDNDFAMMFGRMNLAKFVEVKAKEDEIRGKQVMRHMKDNEQKIDEFRDKLAKKNEDVAELEKTVEKHMEHDKELRGEIEVLQNKFNMKCNDIVEKNNTIDELKAEREELRAKVDTYKGDNFDLQADIDRLRHQLEAIKNIIAL